MGKLWKIYRKLPSCWIVWNSLWVRKMLKFSPFLCFGLGLGEGGECSWSSTTYRREERRQTTMLVRGGGNLNRTYMKQHKILQNFQENMGTENTVNASYTSYKTRLHQHHCTATLSREFIEFKLFYVCCALFFYRARCDIAWPHAIFNFWSFSGWAFSSLMSGWRIPKCEHISHWTASLSSWLNHLSWALTRPRNDKEREAEHSWHYDERNENVIKFQPLFQRLFLVIFLSSLSLFHVLCDFFII